MGYVPSVRNVNAGLAALLFWAALILPVSARAAEAIVVLGDSLTAGYGLPAGDAFPTRLQAALKDEGREVAVLNAGVSGDTSAGGRSRLDWTLSGGPAAMILELGANDGMRGIPLEEIEKNLNGIIDKAQDKNVPVFLMDMYIPSNFGKEYTDGFHALFAKTAKAQDVPLLPFLIKDIAGKAEFNQADGIHPTADGHVLMADVVRESIKDWRMGWAPNK